MGAPIQAAFGIIGADTGQYEYSTRTVPILYHDPPRYSRAFMQQKLLYEYSTSTCLRLECTSSSRYGLRLKTAAK